CVKCHHLCRIVLIHCYPILHYSLMLTRPPRPTLFPYTTLFRSLSVLSTAEYRDILVFGRVRLENMTTQLEEKWNGILNDDGRLDERELRVMADIYGVLARLASESDTKRQSTRNAIQVITNLAAQTDFVAAAVPGPIASAVSQATGIIAEAAKQYNEYRTAV